MKPKIEAPFVDWRQCDELSLCDEEIRAVFKGTNHFIGTPTLAQLVKEIRLLREALERK